jgi:hypothetical protein
VQFACGVVVASSALSTGVNPIELSKLAGTGHGDWEETVSALNLLILWVDEAMRFITQAKMA